MTLLLRVLCLYTLRTSTRIIPSSPTCKDAIFASFVLSIYLRGRYMRTSNTEKISSELRAFSFFGPMPFNLVRGISDKFARVSGVVESDIEIQYVL